MRPLLRSIAALMLFAVLLAAGGRGFRSQHMLEEHFAKYGPDFGPITVNQYLRLAQQLRDARSSRSVLESRRSDGSGAKFDRKRGWYVAYEPDGTLKMFFVPKDGIRYFEWQTAQSIRTK